MGKTLKYCNSCEEGFAERFTFCPDCGASLQSVQVNPIEAAANEPQAPAFNENAVTADEAAFAAAPTDEIPAVQEEEEVVEEEPVYAAAATAPAFTYRSEPIYADEARSSVPPPIIEDGFHVTVIEEKNGSQRNGLLLAAAVFAVFASVTAWGISLFQKDLNIGAIGDERSLAMLIDDVPMPVEDEPKPEQKKDDAGGGGGGGRKDEQEVNQGDLADQTPDPIRPPDAKIPKLDNPELVLPPPSTEGNKKFPKEYDRWGDPSKFGQVASNGPGTGGGMGSGTGLGQGSGTGTGAGSGSGSGYGSGVGDGNGNGTGSGNAGSGGPPPAVARVTQPLRIISKQKAAYTDAARTNNVQGTVTLRVTFNANGSIGGISTIKGLPHGLTEQAIAAARAIRFEPEMVNGVARTTSRPVSFTFNIY